MAPVPPVSRPTWSRRIAPWTVLMFFVTLIVLTYFAVYYSNKGDPQTAGYLAGLASVVPVLLVVVPFYATPIWGIPVSLKEEEIANALARATPGLRAVPVAEREGPFSRCVSVVRFEAPACTVGWYKMEYPANVAQSLPRATVVLRPHTRDRTAVAAFRERLAASFLETGSRPA